ncbi:Rhs element Vgr protein, partial [Pseudomonas sp. M47T1]|uniref:type VI secretion system tip protein TssI/VgrG n=1 Tax=Pseudomonas sp. M47T1 TaxID=1179778 RepID=UPI00026067FD
MFAPADQTQFSITFDGLESDFQVLAFTGIEGISQPYRFEIDLVSERPDVDIETFLHQQAFFALDANGSGIHGQVYQIAQGDNGKRLHRYKVVLTPQLVYLAHRINQRIYQQMSAPKIIALILEEHGILGNAYQFQLSAPCPDRDYCVQYDESDLHFVQRLCEEEGIHYHFEHSNDGHLLVFGDDQTFFPKLDAPTSYVQDTGMTADNPVIKRFSVRVETRTSRVTRRDHDFQKPRLDLESAYRPSTQSAAEPDLEDYDYPGRFTDRTRGKQLSQRALERHRADYRLAEGRSDQTTLVSGHFLPLAD